MEYISIAEQAFESKNYELVAQIYEHQIAVNGPQTSLYLELANTHAINGHLKEAVTLYGQAFSIGKVIDASKLAHLVTALVNVVVQEDSKDDDGPRRISELFSCSKCKAIWSDPVTMKCGHTYCRQCTCASYCRKCEKDFVGCHVSRIKSNILLSDLVNRFYPADEDAIKYKNQGNLLIDQEQYHDAIDAYTKAIACCEYLLIWYW